MSHLDTALSSHEGLHVFRMEALYDVLELDVLIEDVEALVLPFLNENDGDRGYVVEVAHLSIDTIGTFGSEVIKEGAVDFLRATDTNVLGIIINLNAVVYVEEINLGARGCLWGIICCVHIILRGRPHAPI
ncbi:hypothetical protein UFOVP344_23 [uncultured Caudovirales phage]|uniref:Uncharacterized protein n=1 Tax=uncultured Caudovirales phage TaxID=2100421 RepID=A0A6J5LXC9_9CAUD|nr:hypothetical protein UFOVP344_23 [uncultured Caudovirales phage]